MTRDSISPLALAGSLAAIGWAAPILLATARSAAADPVFSIDAELTTPEGAQSVIGSDIGAPPKKPYTSSRSVNAGIPGAAVSVGYSVVGGRGFLGSLSSAAALAPGGSIQGTANATIGVTLDNLKLIDPGMPAGTPVLYDINFEIGGKIVVAAFGASSALAFVTLSYDFAPGSGVTLGEAQDSTIPSDSAATGIFSAGVSYVNAHTPLETGFVDEDVFAEFLLGTHASADANPTATESGQASASSDFLDPFSFPTDGPVFNFFDANGNPLAGVTVDSSDGCIVNNRFLCGGGPAAVPEPSIWTLMLLGFAGLGYAGWRRDRRHRSVPTGEEIGYDQF